MAEARKAAVMRTEVRWAPSHVPEAEAGGPKISRADWEGNRQADHWAKEALKDTPRQDARAKLIEECDTLALGALQLGIAVYSQVVLEREERGALPVRRDRRATGSGGSKPKARDWPWEIKGHRIQALGEAHWQCDYCRKQARTKTSLATLGKRQCHRGMAITPREKNDRSQMSKWTKRAAEASGRAEAGGPPQTTHDPERQQDGWRCSRCRAEARTLGQLGFFCEVPRMVQAPGQGMGQPAQGSQDIRRFFAAARPLARPPDPDIMGHAQRR